MVKALLRVCGVESQGLFRPNRVAGRLQWARYSRGAAGCVLVAKATDAGRGGAPLVCPSNLQLSCQVFPEFDDIQAGWQSRRIRVAEAVETGLAPPHQSCPPACLSTCLFSFIVGLLLSPPTHLMFWDEPAGLVECWKFHAIWYYRKSPSLEWAQIDQLILLKLFFENYQKITKSSKK